MRDSPKVPANKILIIEDERVIRSALRRLLERNGYEVTEAGSVPDAAKEGEFESFDLIISDLRLPGPPGTEVITRAGDTPVLIMTSFASIKSAVEAMQMGAADYVAKPFDHAELLSTVARLLESRRLKRQNAALKSDVQRAYPVSGIVGECRAMQDVFEHIRKIAPTDSTVLVLGESGTGKELVARALHEQSLRRDGPLITVNCAAIAESLIEAELFGHEKGAFTGAIERREGLVEAAHGGTLFMDEIGELPVAVQARLLRVLQAGEIRRVGAAHVARVDMRLIAATNRDLSQMVREGEFREDLFYRLRVMEIGLPPLRERGEDLLKLAHYMLEKVCGRLNRSGIAFSSAALEAIGDYPWPGNVRELENAVERAVILADGVEIDPELLAIQAFQERIATKSERGTTAPPELSLDDYFVHFVLSNQITLNETELSRRLGISRKSLWERRQRLGIPRPGRKEA
jgi:DNA-binding NtrC family response regulator